MTITSRGAVSLLILSLVLVLGCFAYAPALSGALLLDDVSNLSGLANIENRLSALIFILSGDAGPLGRPIALATFAAQADAWGSSPRPFLLLNVLIHLVNGLLLACMIYQLACLSRVREENRAFVAISATAIWLFMPLLASASLMVVQRMTTLSASFMLLGLIGYLHARAHVEDRPLRSLVGMSVSLFFATGLAVFTKENGALLPSFVLILEATILPRPANAGRVWQVWKTVFLFLPTAAILTYLAFRVPYDPSVVLKEGFTGWQRLMTESRILWEYLLNAFIPRPGEFGPFHDGYPVARTIFDPVTLAAFSSWILAIALAMTWRRRYPWLAFAVLWFVVGHLLESTTIPLELFFEHRNYLPIIGPVLALCVGLQRLGNMYNRHLAYGGVAVYALANAFVLFTHTTLWGNPAVAARYWQEHFPNSVRAATTAITYRLDSRGAHSVIQDLHHLARTNPGAAFVRIPELSLSCVASPKADHGRLVTDLHATLKDADFDYTVVTMLSELFTIATRVDCNGVDGSTVRALAKTLLSNRRYRHDTKYNQLHHQLVARTLRYEGEFEKTIQHLQAAIEHQPSAELNMMVVTTYADSGNIDAARQFIEEARRNAPWQPMKRFVWLKRLDILSRYIDHSVRNRSKT